MFDRPTIALQPSGRRFQAGPSETILDAALRQGIALPHACRDGRCGACRVRLISGDVCQDITRARAFGRAAVVGGPDLLTCCSTALCDIVIDAVEVAPGVIGGPRRLPARVAAIDRVTRDVAVVHLRLPRNERLDIRPGQFIGVQGPDGESRYFSVAKWQGDEVELHVGRASPSGFTAHVLDAMALGEMLRIEGPFGAFGLCLDSDRPVLMVAGGTGFAPIHAMIDALAVRDAGRSVRLYWGSRTRDGFYAPRAIAAWRAGLSEFHFVPVVSQSDDAWHGRRGRVHEAVLADWPDLSGFDVYVCGAPALVDAARLDFAARGGLPRGQFHADTFHPSAEPATASAVRSITERGLP